MDLEPNDLIKDLLRQLGESGAIQTPAGEPSFQGDPVVFAASATPKLVTIVGYLSIARSDGTVTWRQFYLDLNLQRCLWIDNDAIVAHQKLKERDFKAPASLAAVRDLIWVKDDAQVVVADASASAEVQFLNGDFTRAGDVDVDAIVGAVNPATGKFCGRSPACCAGRTPR